VKKNGLFRAAGPAKVALIKGNDAREITYHALENILLGAPLNDYRKNDKRLTHSIYNFSHEAVLHYNMFHQAQVSNCNATSGIIFA